jgi:iron complex transport system substrate-binding protein
LVVDVRNQISGLKNKLGSTGTVRVLWVVQAEPVRAAGRSTFVNELIELAGGENALGPTIQQYPQIGTEELLACGAETIIQSAMGTKDLDRQQQAAEAFWQKFENLPAVKDNRIYVVQPDTVLRLSPRLGQGVELVAQCLHPKLFAQTGGAKQQDP